ncbi:MAG: aminotransferase class IV, partial [Chloroflexota bacterium]
AKVLGEKRPSFALLESLLWTPEAGYYLLERHVDRLRRSAVYFGMEVAETAVVDRLLTFAQSLTEASKVRLTVDSGQFAVDGLQWTVSSEPLAAGMGQLKEPIRVGLAAAPVSSGEVFLYHKTTRRQDYAQALASRPDCDDVILWNERDEVTEASSSNIVVEMAGALLTPPVSCGLLAGTLREEMLENGRIREQVLTKEDLRQADAIFLINSVRGWRSSQLD